jgi:hypothetical protein
LSANVNGQCLIDGLRKPRSEVLEEVLDSGKQIAAEGIFIMLGAKGAVEFAGRIGVLMDAESIHCSE